MLEAGVAPRALLNTRSTEGETLWRALCRSPDPAMLIHALETVPELTLEEAAQSILISFSAEGFAILATKYLFKKSKEANSTTEPGVFDVTSVVHPIPFWAKLFDGLSPALTGSLASCLCIAATKDEELCIRALRCLMRGATADPENVQPIFTTPIVNSFTPLFTAVENSRFQVADFLRKTGASLTWTTAMAEYSAFFAPGTLLGFVPQQYVYMIGFFVASLVGMHVSTGRNILHNVRGNLQQTRYALQRLQQTYLLPASHVTVVLRVLSAFADTSLRQLIMSFVLSTSCVNSRDSNGTTPLLMTTSYNVELYRTDTDDGAGQRVAEFASAVCAAHARH